MNTPEQYIGVHKAIPDWEIELNMGIIDPDGFNRKDEDLYLRLFSFNDFILGAAGSTQNIGKFNNALKKFEVDENELCDDLNNRGKELRNRVYNDQNKYQVAELPEIPPSGKPKRIIIVAKDYPLDKLNYAKEQLIKWEKKGGILMINEDVKFFEIHDNKLFEIVTELKEVEGITINE